ncbi:MAG: iron-sulfur cluster-binding protein [Anaerolineae bacterium]|nr:MAG: iron-sulfur cluster-binding protein [Anaerolineae bacterium]
MNDVSFHSFRAQAAQAIANAHLQSAIDGATLKFRTERKRVLADLPDVEAMRDHFKAMRAATLAHLDEYLEQFERNARAAGAQVHWARDAAEAQQIVIGIARQHGATLAVKSKSMTTEEIHLNAALAEAGITTVETDLGEWIVQLAAESPAHIVVPALHKTRQQVAELFSREVGKPLSADDIPTLTNEARRALREKFLAAQIGISGANLGVAETGSIVLVTNEGNGRMVSSVPPVHVAVMGIEKICPTWDDAAVWLELLARSSTGQPLSVYTTALTGPAREGDPDGPRELHIVLYDGGRSRLLGTSYEEVLQCIRCGACLNHCPVYQEAGGHAYGHAYSGPIGAVLVPLLVGLEQYEALPHASSLCGACLEVCPARIDLPRMLLDLRAEEVARGIIPPPEQAIEKSVAWLLGHRRLFNALTDLGRVFQRPLVSKNGLRVPRRLNPAQDRQLPSLAPRSFHDLWQELAAEEAAVEPAPPRRRRPSRRTVLTVAGVSLLPLALLWRLLRRKGGKR